MHDSQIATYKEYLNMLIQGHINSVLCQSKGGYGKTHSTIQILKEANVEYDYSSGVATAVALFKLLYENSDKILILDDIETIFKDDRIINLLKSALWEVDGKRVVTYRTSSKVLADYPDSFEYTGKLVILANELKGKKDESYKALLSRCLKFELKYSLPELKNIAFEIVDCSEELTTTQQIMVKYIIDSNIDVQHDFNLRLLKRLIVFVKYDIEKAEQLFMDSLDVDEETEILVDIINEYPEVKIQVMKFYEKTGQSRMTFFRKKKKLKIESVI